MLRNNRGNKHAKNINGNYVRFGKSKIMKNGSNLTMKDNGTARILLWSGKVKVAAGNTLTITGTGKDIKEITDSRYDGA